MMMDSNNKKQEMWRHTAQTDTSEPHTDSRQQTAGTLQKIDTAESAQQPYNKLVCETILDVASDAVMYLV